MLLPEVVAFHGDRAGGHGGKNEHAGGADAFCLRQDVQLTHHAGHVVGVVAVLSRNNLVLRGDEGGVAQAHKVVPLVLKLLHVLLVFFGQCLADFVAAGNGGAHFLHAGVGLRVGGCLRFCLQRLEGCDLRDLEQFGYGGFFFVVSPHAKDLYEHGQGQAG